MKKGGKELPASIPYGDWESRFSHTIDGYIKPSENDSDAQTAIDILNLNDQSLIRMRRTAYDVQSRQTVFVQCCLKPLLHQIPLSTAFPVHGQHTNPELPDIHQILEARP